MYSYNYIVKDIINGVCYQSFEKHLILEQKKSRPTRKFGRGTIIISIFDYRFNSNKHTQLFLFVTQAFCFFRIRLWVFLVCNLGLFDITEWETCM